MTRRRWILAGMITVVTTGTTRAEDPAAYVACRRWAAAIRPGDTLTDAMRANAEVIPPGGVAIMDFEFGRRRIWMNPGGRVREATCG